MVEAEKDSWPYSLRQLTVKTVTGQLMRVSLEGTNLKDWRSKSATKDCESCPLCVSPEHTEVITQILGKKGKFSNGIVVGVCAVKEASSGAKIPKLLEVDYLDDESVVKGCTVSKKIRQ